MSTKRRHACTDSDKPATPTSTKHLGASSCNGTTIEEPPPSLRQPLPVDLQLEIVARSDVATILRCAATSKPLHGTILDPDFRRRLALRVAANGGFNPALLLRVAYQFKEYSASARSECVVQTSQRHGLDAGLSEWYRPVASRDGLIVLLPAPNGDRLFTYYNHPPDIVRSNELCVRNTFTDHVTALPRSVLLNDVHDIYPLALLTVDDAGRSFKLLVADWSLQTQNFSSKDGKWGAVGAAHLAPGQPCISGPVINSLPTVIGRTVHWLSHPGRHPLYSADDAIILALHADAARATTVELPQGCVSRMLGCTKDAAELLLGASADGRLRLVVAEREVISMWTLLSSEEEEEEEEEPTKRWSRQVVIHRQGIDRQLTGWEPYGSIEFVGFGERSGAVLLEMAMIGLVQLNLATKEALILCRRWGKPHRTISQACLHEIDLASLLQALKSF